MSLLRIVVRCQDAALVMSAAQDRRLPIGQRVAMLAHLAMCAACRRWRRQIRQLDRILHDRGTRTGPEGISPVARERIVAALKQRINPS